MTKLFKKHWLPFLSLVLAVLLAYFRFSNGIIQQDNYVSYATYLPNSINQISFFDSRLFPGLPILIYVVAFFLNNYYLSGYVLMIASFIGSYILLYKMTKSNLSIIPLIFPPIMLNLATLINTEYPFIFLILFSLYFYKNKKYWLTFLILGISIWFRLAGVAVLGGIFIYQIINSDWKVFIKNLPYFFLPVVLFLIYNHHFYGPNNLFYQLFTYQSLHPNRISIGIIQLVQDLFRSLSWHWYRIFASGLFYLIFYILIWAKTIKTKSIEFWIMTVFYVYILSVNLVPFLENLGRYLAPIVPVFWLIIRPKFKNPNLAGLLLLFASILIVVL